MDHDATSESDHLSSSEYLLDSRWGEDGGMAHVSLTGRQEEGWKRIRSDVDEAGDDSFGLSSFSNNVVRLMSLAPLLGRKEGIP